MRVLHIVPPSAIDARQLYLGGAKDLRARTEYLTRRGIAFDQVIAPDRSDPLLLAELRTLDLTRYTHALIELALYPQSLQFLRATAPEISIVTRATNAEFYHRLHFYIAILKRGGGDAGPTARRVLREAVSRLKLDWVVARRSDCVLSISRWEEKHYWRYLAGPSKIRTAPYFLPTSYVAPPSRAPVDKELLCVCLTSSTDALSPFLLEATEAFADLVGQLGRRKPHWRFSVTGNVPPTMASGWERVTLTGMLTSPFDALAPAKAVAVLSSYGFGFKTKLLDALTARCHVLVPPRLHARLPEEVHPYCKIVRRGSLASFVEALEQCEGAFPPGDPNGLLRRQAFATLDSVFFPGRAPWTAPDDPR